MAKCHLIIDSCCDLPASVVRRPGVTLMKFPYTVDGGTFEDDLFESVSAEAFYGAMRKGAEPSTAQVTLQTLTDTFTAAAGGGGPEPFRVPAICETLGRPLVRAVTKGRRTPRR